MLLKDASKKQRQQLVKVENDMLPVFVNHALWRPKARAFIGALMHKRDVEMLREDLDQGIRLAGSLGIDVSDLRIPAFE